MGAFLKVWWKIKNWLEVEKIKAQKLHLPVGCLTHKKDPRDHKYLSGSCPTVQPKKAYQSTLNHWRFDQRNLNICVFASNVLYSSFQEGKRFSVKFAVKMAMKEGDITGNGFSFLRAALNIAVKYGRLPYELMPDEVNESWESYSDPDAVTPEMLTEAANWKAPSYKLVSNLQDAIQLIDNGYVLFTALTWYSNMNMPQPADFYLNQTGDPIGGHAIGASGYRAPNLLYKDIENCQTFGDHFADGGVAHIRDIFADGYMQVYMLEKIEGRTDEQRVAGRYEGECIKGSGPAIYTIQDGKKRAIPDMETYTSLHNNYHDVEDEMIAIIPDGDPVTSVNPPAGIAAAVNPAVNP